MVCTTNDLQGWKDFPKGLRVLLLDGDSSSAAEIKSKLEEMEYVVVTYCNENDALSAISSTPETFHVAIVEVTTSNHNGNFKFLEAAKDLPTIMISSIHCLSTMMKCIALGAIEFLQKPLSEDKLRNIWQHVVHKVFNAGGSALPGSLKPIKESVVSMLHLDLENRENQSIMPKESEILNREDHELPEGSDKYPAPSTPQQGQGMRLVDDGDCQDQTNCSVEKEGGEQDEESKSVETTCVGSLGEGATQVKHSQLPVKEAIKDEENSADGCRAASNTDHESYDGDNISSSGKNKSKKACGIGNTCGTKGSRKKLKVDWTPELHKKFVQAVEQLGVNQAIPSRILELMKVEGLTRHNVASHLQKYRMQKRHILPKEEDGSWSHSKDPMRKNYFSQKPVMAFPPYHSNPAMPVAPIYPSWSHMVCPSAVATGVQMWVPPGYPPWQPPEVWHWKSYPGMQADAWGCPVTPPAHGPLSSHPQHFSRFENVDKSFGIASIPDLQLAEEEIDKVVKEAISKPWLPLPLGLKPPSAESVLSELSRRGIAAFPPPINGAKLR